MQNNTYISIALEEMLDDIFYIKNATLLEKIKR